MDEKKITESLSTVFSGAFLMITGFLLGGILTLATKIAIARFLNSELYGVFSQGMALVYTLIVISIFGLNGGAARFISYYADKNEEKAVSAVPSSLVAVIPGSILVFGLLFVFSDSIAALAFQDPRTAVVLKAYAVAAPFMAVNSLFLAGFRGRKSSKEKVILMDLLVPFIQLFGILLVAFLGLGFTGAVFAFIAIFIPITFVNIAWYSRKHEMYIRYNVIRELIGFSWPLMVSAVAAQIFLWGPSLLVGFLAPSRDVGLLNSAIPLGNATKMFISSVSFLLLPVASDLFSRNKLDEAVKVYSSATRWIVVASVPMIAWMFLLPGESISFLYGVEYQEAGIALMFMMAGYLLNVVTGPLASLLIALGKTKVEMVANVLKLIVFLVSALITIPKYGFVGGAASFALGMIVGNLLRFLFSWPYLGMFYSSSFLKPFIAVIPASLVGLFVHASGIFLPIALGSFCITYLLFFMLMRPIEGEDRELIRMLQKRAGLENHQYLNLLLRKLS